VQRQSASASPGIATVPRSVVQVPMADAEPTVFPEVSVPSSAAVQVPEEEEEKVEDTESGNSDDDEDMDDINHTTLPKEVVRPNSPTVRPQTEDIWKHVSRIAKHDVPDRAMKTECTKFGYLPMMTVATLGALNAESFCERVLSCVKLVVFDLHVRLKSEEIRILVMLRMNHGFMEYMRSSYPDSIVGIPFHLIARSFVKNNFISFHFTSLVEK
jgi:hypothetical protein